MSDINKAEQEAWDLFESAPMWTREGNFRKGFRAGAEWREGQAPKRPKIVCLCGSTRFRDAFEEANLQETLAGRIVLSVGGYPHHDGGRTKEMVYGPGQEHVKPALDQLHFRKIELADEILVLNVGGYVGESTRNEIRHAEKLGKSVRYLEKNVGKTCHACAFSGIEPDDLNLTCHHPDAGTFGLHIRSEPLEHCGWKKFEQHPGRKPDGSLIPDMPEPEQDK